MRFICNDGIVAAITILHADIPVILQDRVVVLLVLQEVSESALAYVGLRGVLGLRGDFGLTGFGVGVGVGTIGGVGVTGDVTTTVGVGVGVGVGINGYGIWFRVKKYRE